MNFELLTSKKNKPMLKDLNGYMDFLKEFAVKGDTMRINPSLWIGACANDIPTQSNSFDCGVFVCKLRTACLVRSDEILAERYVRRLKRNRRNDSHRKTVTSFCC
uniref:Ubiquitin-like protease family profile domain-containing protein n=1 Tax=Ditylenchus dipsaci TaxID=166011 RepID=A0A915E3G4_9BILA